MCFPKQLVIFDAEFLMPCNFFRFMGYKIYSMIIYQNIQVWRNNY